MSRPLDRLDEAYLDRRQAAEEAELLEFQRQRLQSAGGAPTDPSADAVPRHRPGATRSFDAPSVATRVGADVATGLTEAPRQVLGGVRDAFVEAGRAIEAAGNALREQTVIGRLEQALGLGKVQVAVPEVQAPESVTGGVVRSAAQFISGFVPFFKATKAVGITGAVTRGAVAGAATDVTVFDPHQPRVSNLINDLAPELRTPVTEYLATSPDDGEAEGRLKNAIEGLGLGILTEGVLRTARALRAVRLAGSADSAGRRSFASEREAVGDVGAPDAPAASTVPAAPTAANEPLVTVRPATPEDSAAFRAELGQDLQIEGKVVDINFDRLSTSDDVKQALAATTRLYRDQIDAARRGVRSNAETAKAADAMGLRVETLLARREGQAFNAEEALAVRQMLVASAKRVRTLADQVAGGDRAAVDPFLQHLGLHREIQAQAAAVRAEAGRALQIFRVGVNGEVEVTTALGQVLDQLGSGVTAERLANMVRTLETPAQLATFTRTVTKPGLGDAFTEYWINSLLSGPQTHVVNAVSNALTVFQAVAERTVAAGLGLGQAGHVQPGEVPAMLYGLVEGIGDGWRLAAKALREGAPSATKLDPGRRRAITAEAFDLTGPLGRGVDLLGEAVRLPGRLLMTTDEFFKAVNFRMELRAQAYREAASEGLTGGSRATRVAELISDPPAAVKTAADQFALYQTFQQALGPRARGVQQAVSGPLGKLVVPFVKTPTNIAKYVGERTPGLNLFVRGVRDDLAAGGARRDLAVAKVALGGATMAWVATQAAGGTITGGGPKSPELRQAWLKTHQPYSFKVGDTWVGYNRLDPVGAEIGLAADFVELAGDLSEADATELTTAIVLAFAKNLTSKTYVKGVAEALAALADPDRDGQAFFRSLARSTVPTGVATVERTLVDPTLRETRAATNEVRTLLNEACARVPGCSSSLPPKRDLFGEAIRQDQIGYGVDLLSPVLIRQDRPNPVAEELVRLRVPLRMPERSIPGGASGAPAIPLTPEEYDQYVQLAAGLGLRGSSQTLEARLAHLIASETYQRQSEGPDGGQALLVRQVVQAYRQAAQAQLVAESPELERLQRASVTRRVERLRPTDGGAFVFPGEPRP